MFAKRATPFSILPLSLARPWTGAISATYGVYGLVGVLWLWALNSRRPRTPSSLYLALIIAPLLGILTEVSQIPMATRVFSLRDLGANVIAALIGVVLTTRLIRSIENVSANPSLQRTR